MGQGAKSSPSMFTVVVSTVVSFVCLAGKRFDTSVVVLRAPLFFFVFL